MSSANVMRLKVIKDYLKSKFITVPDQWILNQFNSNDCNQESVYRFWLNTDLRNIQNQNPILPRDINVIQLDDNKQTAIKSTLNGKYALQINSIGDISKPQVLSSADALDDEENESGINSEDSDVENNTNMFKRKNKKTKKAVKKKGPRMLLMSLTDGITECKAIEYQPIEELNVNTVIGTKLIISGPFNIQTAIVFLTSKNVKVLGGSIPIQTQPFNGIGLQ